MTDLRQGVTEVEHQVLDKAAELRNCYKIDAAEDWLALAKDRIAKARRASDSGTATRYAIEAAAAAMQFAEQKRRDLAYLRGESL